MWAAAPASNASPTTMPLKAMRISLVATFLNFARPGNGRKPKVNNAVKFQQLDFNQPFDLPSIPSTWFLFALPFTMRRISPSRSARCTACSKRNPAGGFFTTGPMPNNKAVFYEIIKEATGKPIPLMPGSSRYASEIYSTMQQLFSKVEQHIFENHLIFPTVELFMEYTRASMSEDRRLWNALFVTHEDFGESDDADRGSRPQTHRT